MDAQLKQVDTLEPSIEEFSAQHRHCKNCGEGFVVEPEDSLFYWRIGPRVGGNKFPIPPPDFCRRCRRQRRHLLRNQIELYKRECDLSSKSILSVYHPGKRFPVFFHERWWEKKRRGLEFGRPIDFSRPFFEQFIELQNEVPVESVRIVNCENSEYCNNVVKCKNCYLVVGSTECWDCLYMEACTNCKNSLVAWQASNLELSYNVYRSTKLFACFYCELCFACSEAYFCRLCFDCHHCFGCINLRHRKYCIFNKQYTPSAYRAFLKSFQPGSYRVIEQCKEKTRAFFATVPAKGLVGWQNENCFGDVVFESRNCDHCFSVAQCEESKFLHDVRNAIWSYDVDYSRVLTGLCYDVVQCSTLFHTCFAQNCHNCSDSFYIMDSVELKHCFGCTGLYHEHHCILNRRYSPEEYERLVSKLIRHMIETGEWGKQFVPQTSRYGYQESTAGISYPLSKEEALEKGYYWSDLCPPEHKNTVTILEADELPDSIDEVNDDILFCAIRCTETGKLFRIQRRELDLLRKLRIPLPRLCFAEGIRQIKIRRNKMVLHDRRCEHEWEEEGKFVRCSNTFPSTYTPGSSQVLLCEECFNEAFFYKR